jgi:outer membrane protein
MKSLYKLTVLLLIVLINTALNAQNTKRWTLQECIEYAIKNNFQIAQNQLTVEQNKVTLLQSKATALPAFSGTANHTYNTGRRIDPFSNQFANKRVLSQNFSVSGSINLISGLSNTQTILANQLTLIAAQYSNDQLKNDIALQVTNAFLAVVLNRELQNNAEFQLQLSEKQKERAQLLYEVGRTAKSDFLQLEATLSNDNVNVVTARNRADLSLLTLAQLLSLESVEGFDIEIPNFNNSKIEMPPYNAKDLFTVALEKQPNILSSNYRILSAEKSLKAARGSYYPSLSAFAGIGTGYSQLSRKVIGTTTQQQNFGSIQGTPIIVDVEVPIYEKTPFHEQLNQNFNRTVGFSLSVPLFSGLRTRSQVSLQKINLQNVRLQQQITKLQLNRDIQTAYFDCKSAFERYNATVKSVSANQEAFDYIQERFEVGLINIIEFTTSKNLLQVAQSNLAQARYEFILRAKVLDFYQGKPITF